MPDNDEQKQQLNHWRAIAEELGIPTEPDEDRSEESVSPAPEARPKPASPQVSNERDQAGAFDVRDQAGAFDVRDQADDFDGGPKPTFESNRTAPTRSADEPTERAGEERDDKSLVASTNVSNSDSENEEDKPRRGHRRGRRGRRSSRRGRPGDKSSDQVEDKRPVNESSDEASVVEAVEGDKANDPAEDSGEERPRRRRRSSSRSRGRGRGRKDGDATQVKQETEVVKSGETRRPPSAAPVKSEPVSDDDGIAIFDSELDSDAIEMLVERERESVSVIDEATEIATEDFEFEPADDEEDNDDMDDEEDNYSDWQVPSWDDLIASLYRPSR